MKNLDTDSSSRDYTAQLSNTFLDPNWFPTTTTTTTRMMMTHIYQSEGSTLFDRKFPSSTYSHQAMSIQERMSFLMSTIDRALEICDYGHGNDASSTGHPPRNGPTNN